MLWRGDLHDQNEGDFLQLAMSGVRSSMQELLQNFGNLWSVWHHDSSLATSTPYDHMWSGNTNPCENSMCTPLVSTSTYQEWRSSANGYVTLCLNLVS